MKKYKIKRKVKQIFYCNIFNCIQEISHENWHTGKRRCRSHAMQLRKLTKIHKIKISKAHKGKKLSQMHKKKISQYHANVSKQNNPFYNKKHNEQSLRQMSLSHGGTGIPYENNKYCQDWTDQLKYNIRKRDNFECQNCNMIEEEHLSVYGRVLEVHHIDYNKKNCKENNLISLCKGCNIRANYNRKFWFIKFKKVIING